MSFRSQDLSVCAAAVPFALPYRGSLPALSGTARRGSQGQFASAAMPTAPPSPFVLLLRAPSRGCLVSPIMVHYPTLDGPSGTPQASYSDE